MSSFIQLLELLHVLALSPGAACDAFLNVMRSRVVQSSVDNSPINRWCRPSKACKMSSRLRGVVDALSDCAECGTSVGPLCGLEMDVVVELSEAWDRALVPASQYGRQGAESLGFLDPKGFESPNATMSSLPSCGV